MNLTYFLFVILFLLIIYYFYLRNTYENKYGLMEGFRFRIKIKNPLKNIGKKITKIGKKKPSKKKIVKATPACELDVFNFAILQVINKATDQESIPGGIEAYVSGLKTYMEDSFKSNLKLTDAGVALSDEDFETKANEAIEIIRSKKNQNEFTKWYTTFTQPPADVSSEAQTSEAQTSEAQTSEAQTSVE